MGILQGMRNSIKRMDIFGADIMINTENHYRTICGGIFSALVSLTLFMYAGTLFKKMVNYEKVTVVKTPVYNTLTNDTETHYFMKNDMQFVFLDTPWNVSDYTKYLKIEANYIVSEYSEENGMITNYTFIPLVEGNKTHFAAFDTEDYQFKLALKNGAGLESKDYGLSGTTSSIKLSYLDITLQQGQGVHCAPQEEIDKMINKFSFSFFPLNSYIDYKDFNNPIKSYIENPMYMKLDKESFNIVNFKVRKNEYTIKDNYIKFWEK